MRGGAHWPTRSAEPRRLPAVGFSINWQRHGGGGSLMAAFDDRPRKAGSPPPAYDDLAHWLSSAPRKLLAHRRDEAELLFRRIGITFAVYGDKEGAERLI